MFINNQLIIKKKYPHLFIDLQNESFSSIEVIKAKDNTPTLLINDGAKMISFLSRYNPFAEAAQFVENVKLPQNTEHVLVIGVGLGYHLNALLEKYPDIAISLYEPNRDVLRAFLQHFDLRKIERRLRYFFTDLNEVQSKEQFLYTMSKKSELFILPSTLKFEESIVTSFIQELKEQLSLQKQQSLVDTGFQFKWIENAIRNVSEVMDSPNLFLHTKATEYIKGKPVILVAAGPSLDFEIENLKAIQRAKSAYIFAVGSSINACIANGIIPDALFSYDPTVKNAQVVKKVKDLNLKIPLVFGSTIATEVLQNYPGKKIHFFLNQDSISTNLVEDNKALLIEDGPSIAVITLDILCQLNPKEILLVGQNLGVTKKLGYASGIDYIDNKVNMLDDSQNYILTRDVEGNNVYSLPHFMNMKASMEFKIAQYPNISIINTTKYGVHIEGTTYEPLNIAMDKYLVQENIVEENIFDGQNDYNKKRVMDNYYLLESEFDKLYKNFVKVLAIQKKISINYEKKILNNLQMDLTEFDKYFYEIERSKFFLMIIAPITRVQYKRLVSGSLEVKNETKPIKKAKKFLEIYTKYLLDMYVTLIQIQNVFGELKSSKLFKEVE